MNKKYFYIIITLFVLAMIVSIFLILKKEDVSQDQFLTSKIATPKIAIEESLAIPELLDYRIVDDIKTFELNAQEGDYEFVKDVPSKTYGYNGDILGPTIRFSEGDTVNIHVENNLNEQTTTHWHGGVVPGSADGGVHNIIQSGDDWNARFDVIQEAATLWYHPHQHEETAEQVYKGLGGLIIIDDENSKSLNIPQEYGIDDIPIIIQSKDLSDEGKLLPYQISHMEEIHGFEGNTTFINAQVNPRLDVTTNLVRLRVLNASNSDVYNVSFSDGRKFDVIASDGGFYNEPISLDTLEVFSAKRFEILLDVSDMAGEALTMNINGEPQLSIYAAENLDQKYELPESLNTLVQASPSDEIDRNFDLELLGGGGMMGGSGAMGDSIENTRRGMPVYAINGQLFDMERVDFDVKNDTTEYWKITNIGDTGPGLFHPFHVHATQFNIVEFNGKKPSKLMEGRHDTVVLEKDDTAIIAVPFDKSLEGVYMYHCHILEHEDVGMMGQFELRSN